MKICTIFESEIYLRGIGQYIHGTEGNKYGLKAVLLRELDNKDTETKIFSGLKNYDIIILDFRSYERIINYFKNDPHKTRDVKAKIIFMKLGVYYPIFTIQNQGRSWKFKSVTLRIDHVIQPSISEAAFRRLLFSIATSVENTSLYDQISKNRGRY